MEELLVMMDAYWDTHEATGADGGYKFFENYYNDQEYTDLQSKLMDYLFIGGHWNPETRVFLAEHGYRCWVGDGDSFGILIACITKNGKTMPVG